MATTANIWLPYTQMQTTLPPLEAVATQGSTITLKDGRKLIDSVGSWWTACHGYNHSHIVQAISRQAAILPHIMLGGIIHPEIKKLSARLSHLLPEDLNHFFYSESGSVAIEIAMKMALQYWINQKETQRKYFISFEQGYHGDTFFAMSVCDPIEGMHRLFHSVLPQQFCLPLPKTDDLLEKFELWLSQHASTCAALIIEPLVQGAGGMKMYSAHMLKAIGDLAKRYDLLVIMDEIFTGFGRTGSLFAFEQAKTLPDILCLSKALTGGTVPLAVTITRDFVYQQFLDEDPEKAFAHGSTFSGNAIGCAAANACLDLFESEPRLHQVADIEGILSSTLLPLAKIPGVIDVRVKGAIGVVQLSSLSTKELNWFKQQFIDDGIWCRPYNDIVYTTPAFTIEQDALVQITHAIDKHVRRWSTTFAA